MGVVVCPHGCGISYAKVQAQVAFQDVDRNEGGYYRVTTYRCPSCGGLAVELSEWKDDPDNPMKELVVHPRTARKAAEEVPDELARGFEEAAAVLGDSPRAAAALARRALQHVLREHHGATGGTLEKEIDSVAAGLPSYISQSLHALRQFGNFAAHPVKDRTSGEILDVNPGEAEWTIEVLHEVLEFTFVAPGRQRAVITELNKKLKAAGKPEIPIP